MRASLALLFALAACGGAETAGAPTFEELVRAHAEPELALEGAWVQTEPPYLALFFRPASGDDVHVAALDDEACAWTVSKGRREGATLHLYLPVYGIQRLTLCRFEGQDVLLPDARCWIEPGPRPVARGLVFRREPSWTIDAARGYLPGPDD